MIRSALPLACLVAFTQLGCATKSSSSLGTDQIAPVFDVKVDTVANGANTFISAVLNQPGGTLSRVKLADGDALSARTDKDANLAFTYSDSLQIYSLSLDKVTDRASVTISLARASGAAAPSSTVQLPAAVALTEPAAKAQVPYGGGTGMLSIAWSNAVSGATVTFFTSPCGGGGASTKDLHATDTGTFSIATADLLVGAPPAAGQCVTIKIVRSVTGTVDPAFAPNSTFTASRADYVDVTVMP
jgi:hypothetical protein